MPPANFQVLPLTTADQHQQWDDFASHGAVGHMHQCLWWAQPLAQYGVKSRVLACWDNHQLIGGGLFRSIPVPGLGVYITECLNGPIFSTWNAAWADVFVAQLLVFARATNSMTVALKNCPRHDVHSHLLAALRRARLPIMVTPGEAEAVLAVEGRTIDTVWKGFRKGTKYAIKKGQKGPLHLTTLTKTEDLAKAYTTWMATAARKGFSDVRPWPALEPVLRTCVDHNLGAVFASCLGDEIVAARFVTYIGNTAVLVYAGHVDGSEQHSPNHMLDYEGIRQCPERGSSAYSFGTLTAYGEPTSNGVDEYKLGFGALPTPHHETMTWHCKPLLARSVAWLRRQPVGDRIVELVKKRLLRRSEHPQ